MQNRTRNVQINIRVTPEEKKLIEHKMALNKITHFAAFARKMLIDGYIINVDLKQYHELANEVNKVGVNLNQIAKNVNATGNINAEEMAQLQEMINEIWQLLKSNLSALLSQSR